MSIKSGGGHRMVLTVEAVAHDHELKIFCGNTFEAQCSQFRNGVVLAVAGTTRKPCDRS